MGWRPLSLRLSQTQLEGLKRHKYSSEGTSLLEPVMQVYWRWLVTKVPLWVAPNLLTGVGLLINIATILPLLLLDTKLEGVAPSWTYIAGAVGTFIYQSLDAIDGKQARRTGSANQLGELFDHGCDAISLVCVIIAGTSAIGLHDNPLSLLVYVVLLTQVNFVYHWQTFVCGTLHFNLFDVTEGQFTLMALLVIRGVCGLGFWENELPVLGVGSKKALVWVMMAFIFLDLLLAIRVIVTKSRGGAPVAITTFLAPLITILAQVPVPFLYISFSYSTLIDHSLLFVSAMTLPVTKVTIIMLVSTVTLSPYPPLDPLLLAPWLALLNLVSGPLLPQTLCLAAILVWEVVDISLLSVDVCVQIATYLRIPIFSLPPSVK